MKNLMVFVCFVVIFFFFSEVCMGQEEVFGDSPSGEELDEALAPTSPAGHPLVGAVGVVLTDNANQDRRLQEQLCALKKAQRYFARAKYLKSAVDRIAALEEARKSLPSDLVGKAEIEVLVSTAVAASKARADQAIEAIQVAIGDRVNELETRVSKLETRVTAVEDRVTDLESFADWFRAISLDLGVWGATHSIGSEAGGAVWLLLPLGLESGWTARFGGGIGWADRENTVGWLLEVDCLWRTDWFSVGPSALLMGATDNRGNRDLVPAGGLSLRADFAEDWGFVQVTPFTGVALEDPDKAKFGSGVLVEAGLHF